MNGRALLLTAALSIVAQGSAHAQGWRLRLDARGQSASYRGWRVDSIPVSDTVSGSTGGPETPDGYVANCEGGPMCSFWRPGETQHGLPVVLTADATLWGLGLPGLSARARTRFGADLASGSPWYGPDRTVELVEGYLDLDRTKYTLRAGRQIVNGRLGWWGIDGGRGWFRLPDAGLEFSAYAGWGLARSSNLTVTSVALNPLGDFQTSVRQGAFGGTASWRVPKGGISAEYHREVSGADYGITVERAAVSGEGVITRDIGVSGGAIYDIASGLLGSWDLGARATVGQFQFGGRMLQYRPLFDLWSVWQAFSPSAYKAVDGSASFRATRSVVLRVSGQRYWYDNTETSTALVDVESTGWRATFGGAWSITPSIAIDGEVRREFGVGAYANAIQGSATWRPWSGWSLRANGGHQERPLEYRYDVSTLDWFGVGVERDLGNGSSAGLLIDRWMEDSDRPDAAAFGWDQTRIQARITWLLASSADRLPLPPGHRRGTP
jgi:hypothetical protein